MIEHKFYKEIPLFKMEIFVKFCQLQTLSKTGRAIGLNAADVNNVIISLEKAVDGPVYVRKTDKFTLTKKGEEFLNVCNIMLDAIEKVEAGGFTKKPKKLTIAASMWDSLYQLPTILDEFFKEYKDVNVKLLVGSEHAQFSDPECDVAFGLFIPNKPEIQQRLIKEYGVKFYATEKYIKKNGKPESLKDIKNHKILNHIELPPLEDGVFRNNDYLVSTNSFITLMEFALKGLGLSLLPEVLATRDERGAKNLVEVVGEFEATKYCHFFLNRKLPEKSDMIETLFNITKNIYSK